MPRSAPFTLGLDFGTTNSVAAQARDGHSSLVQLATPHGPEAAFRSAVIRLKQDQNLFQEHDDGVSFIGRSLFRASVDLPVNVPIGRYTADVYLFRDGQVVSKNQSTLEVTQAGLDRAIYLMAFNRPLLYGLVAVLLAVLAGLAGWAAFRRE